MTLKSKLDNMLSMTASVAHMDIKGKVQDNKKYTKKRKKIIKIHKVKMCPDLQTWVTGNETPYCTLKEQKYRIYVSTFKPKWRRVVDVSGCKRDFNSFLLMSILTLISTVPKETIQIIFVAIICAWRQEKKQILFKPCGHWWGVTMLLNSKICW